MAARIAKLCVVSLLIALMVGAAPATSSAQVAFTISVSFGPPALPIYAQPLCPGPGFIWVPGYWAWYPAYGYYWVPGTWVLAPFPGALWTPGYWAWNDADDLYVWYPGYWGPFVGFYGGIVYGYGYTGYGYDGGYWRNGVFFYNRAVNHINVNIRNVYYRQVTVRKTYVSYNGGPGGIRARPTAAQMAAVRERRFGAVDAQMQQERLAQRDRNQRASVNRGRPPIAATARPGAFMTRETVRATRAGAPYKAPPPKGAAPRGKPAPPKRTRPPQAGQPQTQPRQPGTGTEQRPQSQQRPKEARPQTQRERETARPNAGRPAAEAGTERGRQGKKSTPSQPPKKPKKPDGTKEKGKPEVPHH